MNITKSLGASSPLAIVCALVFVHAIVIVVGIFLGISGDFSLLAAEAAALALISPLLRLSMKLLGYVMAMERAKLA